MLREALFAGAQEKTRVERNKPFLVSDVLLFRADWELSAITGYGNKKVRLPGGTTRACQSGLRAYFDAEDLFRQLGATLSPPS